MDENMKKKLFIILFLIIIISLSFLLKKNTKKEINPFQEFPFYKEHLQQEYEEYQKQNNYSFKKTVINVNIGINKPFYTNSSPAKYLNTNYILVNKYNYLSKDYIPNNLVNVNSSGIRLVKEAYDSFKDMANNAKKENLNLRIISAYRSFEYQNNLYNKYLQKDPQDKVDTYSARPGYSEHQTGLSIDIDNKNIDYNKFHLTKEYTWMQNNAYKYGFILRYPLGKEVITGYQYESWHYRYVGKKIAKEIHDLNTTFEEYYYEFIDI